MFDAWNYDRKVLEIIPGVYIEEFSEIHGKGIMASERFPLVVLEMLLSFITCMLVYTNYELFSIRLLYQMWVDVDRDWFVWRLLEVDVQELWSIPSKGGGDDTNTFTTSFTKGSHVRIIHLISRNEAFMVIFTDTYRISGLVLSKEYDANTSTSQTEDEPTHGKVVLLIGNEGYLGTMARFVQLLTWEGVD